MDIDGLREEQDIELQEQMWDTDCDLSKNSCDGYEFQVGNLVADRNAVYKVLSSKGETVSMRIVAHALYPRWVGKRCSLNKLYIYSRMSLWERSTKNADKFRGENPTLIERGVKFETKEWSDNCNNTEQISFDRDNVSSEYNYDILDAGRGLV